MDESRFGLSVYERCPNWASAISGARLHLFALSCRTPWEWDLAYHGTYPHNARNIISNVLFQLAGSWTTTQAFGHGIYLTQAREKICTYRSNYCHTARFQTVIECRIRSGTYVREYGSYNREAAGVEYICTQPHGNIVVTAILFKRYNEIDTMQLNSNEGR